MENKTTLMMTRWHTLWMILNMKRRRKRMSKVHQLDWEQLLAEDDCGLYGHNWKDFVFFSQCTRCGHREENEDEEEDEDMEFELICEDLGHDWDVQEHYSECKRCGKMVEYGYEEDCTINGHKWIEHQTSAECTRCGLILDERDYDEYHSTL